MPTSADATGPGSTGAGPSPGRPVRRVSMTVRPGGALKGVVAVPGDKSTSHRAVILGSIAHGVTEVRGFLEGEDTLATVAACRAMGVHVERLAPGHLRVHGRGPRGLVAPSADLDLGNSGTGMRLLAGVLAGQSFPSRLVGDASLMRRPMGRIADPLALMGARVETGPDGRPPLGFAPAAGGLRGIEYRMPVASAQVKSCLLLAGLYASGRTCVEEPAPTRDHTERMLRGFGCPVEAGGGRVCVSGGAALRGIPLTVPGDISSAAFLVVAALVAAGSDVTIPGVGVNPTRTGVLDILREMGADIAVVGAREEGDEPVADLRVRASDLHGVDVPERLVPLAIDEFPAIFVAAAFARGRTRLTGAAELRVKESDRIAVMAEGLAALGVDATPTPDGMVIEGGAPRGGVVDSHGDHRVAMAFAVAGLRAAGEVVVRDCANVDTSFPGFAPVCKAAGLRIAVSEESAAR